MIALALPGMAAAQELPAGGAAGTVEATCAACHNLNMVTRSMGYDEAGWRAVIATMIDLEGNAALDEMTAYLAEHFPPNDHRTPALVDGSLALAFEDWVSPTLGQRTRDPVEAPDGSIWWAGQWADLVGRIDPTTGEMREFPLPEGSRPHTVTADAEGRMWYTGNGNGTVGYVDPATGEVTVFETPSPDPHSMIVDAAGIVWFTAQRGNTVSRLDPATGEMRTVDMPTANSRPYGIKTAPDGAVWVAANASDRLYRVDPADMAVEEHQVSDPGTHIRRLAVADDGTIWFVNSGLGRLGHYDPASRSLREWDSPSGPGSHPYAIALLDGAVWYNESAQRPDALVRFDPTTETFQSWAVPSGEVHAGIIRHMRPSRDGSALLIHQSSTNRVLRVTPSPPS